LGAYAALNIWKLSIEDLYAFENLLCEADVDIFNWLSGIDTIPDEHNNNMMKDLLQFIENKKYKSYTTSDTLNNDYENNSEYSNNK
jgi:succinate dehydrogenase flavin-adding protein (antitoxin of CptAB toxin-antitoxin module)